MRFPGTWRRCPCFPVVLETTFEATIEAVGPWRAPCQLKEPIRWRQRWVTRRNEREQHSLQQPVIEFAWRANQWFFTIKRKRNRIELVTRPASLCSFPAVACTFQRFRSMQLHAWEMRTALLEACGRFQRRIDSRGGCSCRRGASTLGKLSSPSTGCFCRDVWRYPWQCSVHAAPQWRKGIPFCYPIRPFSASRRAEMQNHIVL